MPKVTVHVSDDLKEEMEKHKEINGSAIARKAFNEKIRKIAIAEAIVAESELTEKDAKDIGEKIKESIAKRHGLSE
ncbi:MAG: hypothetical protein GWO20_18300 [Candidatus Korarchaeota archaeon]|nr:hypothetical protein [Candidatus Korarchaeota archaeon]NIU85238.1 hypothetical protein [Candidatus Thorarchaeota archaeon]NIW15320.1 hypothetical protein [Candidatus Thorarchaeota archaeon]NIW53286.1 hypothetical protein [Candidatus Korarchaeota archaeon]